MQRRFHNCANPRCRKIFYPQRSDALTCSARCRQAYKRFCDAITAEHATARPSKPARKKKPSVRTRKG